MPRAAHRANQQAVSRIVVSESLVFRIPCKPQLQLGRDIAQVADGVDPGCCVDTGDGLAPALDTVQEIPDVVIARFTLEQRSFV